MNIKILLLSILALVSSNATATEEEDTKLWELITNTASAISNNSQDVLKLISLAKHDNNLKEANSSFNKKAQSLFDKTNDYYEFIDDDIENEELPFAVFKTTMIGFGWMSYIDWKDISSSENMIWVLNSLFKKTI